MYRCEITSSRLTGYSTVVQSSVDNGWGLPSFSLGSNRTEGSSLGQKPPTNSNQVPNAGLLPGLDRNLLFFGRVDTGS